MSLGDEDFNAKLEEGQRVLSECTLCGNMCKVDRTRGELGRCEIDSSLYVSSHNIHTGEEPPISGRNGSGTVFLTGCCLSCNFCQNFPISQLNNGRKLSSSALAVEMLKLQKRGAHNINFVAPTHQAPQIVEALFEGKKLGLNIPVVYNTGGYDSLDCLRLLDGIVDIYLPDFKYADDGIAQRHSGAGEYVRTAQEAFVEIYRQAGRLLTDERGIGVKGMIIRHLVLPDGQAGTREVFDWVAKRLSKDLHVSIMGQYFPAYRAFEVGPYRRITEEEYEEALLSVQSLGFENIYRQEIDWEEMENR